MTTRMLLGGLVAIALGIASPGAAHAQVSVNVGIALPAPPSFVVVPGTPVAYAPAVPANYFFYSGQYYVFSNNAWYVGPRYNGPWVTVAPAYVPLPILSVPVRYYKAPPPHWKGWRYAAPPRWDATWGRSWKAEQHAYEKAAKADQHAYEKAAKADHKAYEKAVKADQKAAKEYEKAGR